MNSQKRKAVPPNNETDTNLLTTLTPKEIINHANYFFAIYFTSHGEPYEPVSCFECPRKRTTSSSKMLACWRRMQRNVVKDRTNSLGL